MTISGRARRRAVAGVLSLAAVLAACSTEPHPDAYLISASGIGPIHLGMTLEQARRSLPNATFARVSDGDGAALIEVTVAENASVMVSANEEDPDTPIDWSLKVVTAETFSPAFRTAGGVRPGTLVTDAEKVFGPVVDIMQSEIESREYITFERHPAGLTVRLDYTGIFAGDSRHTRAFADGAKIFSIAVSP